MPILFLRRTLTYAASVLLLIGAAACGGGGDPAADAGAEPGDKKIALYSGRNEKLIQPLLDKFTEQSGIEVVTRYGSTAQIASQLLEEGDKSPADVFFAQDAGALGAVSKKGMLATLPDEITGKVPEGYRAKRGDWIGITARARVLVYNPDLVPADQLPTSVFELTGPQWKGKVGVAPTNGSFQAFVTAMRVLHGEAKTREFLTGLAANEPQIRDNNIKILEDVNAGTFAVGLINHYYLGEMANEQGVTPDALKAKLHFFPDGDIGALVNVAGVGVLKKAATDPDVEAFLDYLLSPAAQRHFAERVSEYPVVAGVPAPGYVPPLDELAVPPVDLNDLDTLQATVDMIQKSGLVP